MKTREKDPLRCRSNQVSLNDLWEGMEHMDRVSIAGEMVLVDMGVLKIPADSAFKKYLSPLLKQAENYRKKAASHLSTGKKSSHIRGMVLCMLKLRCLQQLAYRELRNQNDNSKGGGNRGIENAVSPRLPDRVVKHMMGFECSKNP